MARRIVIVLGSIVVGLAIAAVTGWGALVLFYIVPGPELVRKALAWAFAALGLLAIAALAVRRVRRWAFVAFAAGLVLVVVAWNSPKPSNDRDWQTEVAVLPYATINGDLVTVHNIRNFDYRTETDFTPAYYDRTFDLRRLDRVDLMAVYWMGPAIAHIFLSFGFGDEHLPISIEVRKTRSKEYSTIAGFFRQYELIYIVGDERDVVRVRTNYRKAPPEEVYVFRATGAPIENGRRIFLDYIRDINRLKTQPRFYNTLTTNCTTMIFAHTTVVPGHIPLSWKILLSGYAPEYIYEQRRFDQSLPFEELKRRGYINARAQAADKSPDFSRLIRVGMP
jgi:Domain of unknown function (DUF4105)